MQLREVQGTYPGAAPWYVYDDRSPREIAIELCFTGQCDLYFIDDVPYDASGARVGDADRGATCD
jgi:hypothetical protein